jgi:hypothetical protein
MAMISPSRTTSAVALVSAARKKFCDIESLAALRRHQALVFLSLMFLGPTMFPRPRLIASPVTALMVQGAEASWFARLFAPLLYCAVVFLAFAWQRDMLRGGTFRAYLSSLPLPDAAFHQIDRKLIAWRGWAFLLPQVVAPGVMRDALNTLDGALTVFAAALFMSIVAWRLAVAAVMQQHMVAGITLATVLMSATVIHMTARAGFFVYAATLAAACAIAWCAPAIASRWQRKRSHASKPLPPLQLRYATLSLWLQLPLAVLWHATRSGMIARLIATTALCPLAATGIVWFDMHDRWHGLTTTVFAMTVWLFSSLYEPIAEARQKVPLWKSLPLTRAMLFASDAAAVCTLAFMPIAVSTAMLLAHGFAGVALLAVGAIALLFALRGMLPIPSSWRVVLTPAIVVIFAVVATVVH